MTFRTTLLLFLALLQFSCSEFLKGKPKKEDTIQVSKQSEDCMKDVSEKWKSFLEKSADDKEIDKAFACVDSTMKEFQERVEGRVDANSFTVEELQKVFDKFMTGTKIPADATKDLMMLKAAVIGGSSDKLTKKEITEMRKYMEVIKVEAKALMPYVSLLKFKKEVTPFSKKMLQDGFGQLNISLKTLFRASQVYRSDYQFSDLQKLITHLKILDEEQETLMSLAGLMKNLLGGNQALQAEADYLTFIDNFTEVLRLYSFHIQGYVQFAIEQKESMHDTVGYFENWISLLENSLQFKRSKIVSVETLDPLIAEISKRGLFPIDVQTDTLLQFYKLLIVRGFDSGSSADVTSFTGLTKSHVSRIRREIAVYKLYLQMISQFDLKKITKVDVIQTKVRAFNAKEVAWLGKFDQSSRKLILEAFDELRGELLGEKPSLYFQKKMVIAANQAQWGQNWLDLARGLYVKMLARELLIGWGTTPQTKLVASAFLSEAQLTQWYTDFKQFGIEAKTFDPRTTTSGAVSFKQANLLTYAADGDDRMNFLETVQYLNMLLSGGGQTIAEMRAGFETAKCQLEDKDVFGNYWMDEKCAAADLKQNFHKYFVSLPYMSSFVSKMNDQQFYEYYDRVMAVGRVNQQLKGQRIETADLRNMSMLLYSIEVLYAVYDTNQDWYLSPEEIRGTYPRFKNFATNYAKTHAKDQIEKFNGWLAQSIGGYGCYTEDDLIRESFVFLVFNGKVPQKSDLKTVPCYGVPLMDARPLIDIKGKVGRGEIINTFKLMQSVLGS
jgi:hypothetical protein